MPIFNGLDAKHIKFLLNIIHHRVYEKNEFIFSQGDPGIALYIVKEGEVKIIYKDDSGETHELATLSKGDFFGELAMLNDDVRSASAITSRDSSLAVIFKPDLDEFIEKYPRKGIQILRGISQIMATRLRNLNEDFATLYNKTILNNKELANEQD